MRRYALTEQQWERIKGLLPGRAGTVVPTADNRLLVEGVLYRYRAGIPWRDLPERFGDFIVVHIYVTLDGVKRVFGKKYLRSFHKRPIILTICLILLLLGLISIVQVLKKVLISKQSAAVEQD